MTDKESEIKTCEYCRQNYEDCQETCGNCEQCGKIFGMFELFECPDTGKIKCESCINCYDRSLKFK